MSELKPCPACGGDATTSSTIGAWCVYCTDCSLTSAYFREKHNVIERWNSRPLEDALNNRIKELEDALKRLASPEAFLVPKTATKEEIARMIYAERALTSEEKAECYLKRGDEPIPNPLNPDTQR